MTTTPLASLPLLTLSSVAELTALSERTWHRIVARREIGTCRIGTAIRIPRDELLRYLATHGTPAVDPQRSRPPQSVDRILASIRRPKTGGGG